MERRDNIVGAILILMGIGLLIRIFTTDNEPTYIQTIEKTYSYNIELKQEPIKEEVVEVAADEVQIDEAEVDLLAHLIYAEAGSVKCSDEMRYLVGVVALNRVKSHYFPNTLEEVINQKGQYECVQNGHINYEYTDVCYAIAYELLANGYDVPDNVIFQAEFRQGNGVYKQVQNMYFCYK